MNAPDREEGLFNRRRRMAELVTYAGTFSDEFPTIDEIEAIDGKLLRRRFPEGLDAAGPDRLAKFDAPICA